MKNFTEPLIENKVFHIYTRGIDKKPIFLTDKHYRSFLWKYQKKVSPYVDTYAFCLMGNHFHLLLRVKTYQEIDKLTDLKLLRKPKGKVGLFISRALGDIMNSHAQMFNRATDRTGGLFESPFRRKPVESLIYLTHLIKYIHLNPVKHEIYGNYEFYPYSSYREYFMFKPRIIHKIDGLNFLVTWKFLKNSTKRTPLQKKKYPSY